MKDPAPAFPTWSAKDVVPGMTLRDYFAATALQGLLASNPDYFPPEIVTMAFKYADLMIDKRSNVQGSTNGI